MIGSALAPFWVHVVLFPPFSVDCACVTLSLCKIMPRLVPMAMASPFWYAGGAPQAIRSPPGDAAGAFVHHVRGQGLQFRGEKGRTPPCKSRLQDLKAFTPCILVCILLIDVHAMGAAATATTKATPAAGIAGVPEVCWCAPMHAGQLCGSPFPCVMYFLARAADLIHGRDGADQHDGPAQSRT